MPRGSAYLPHSLRSLSCQNTESYIGTQIFPINAPVSERNKKWKRKVTNLSGVFLGRWHVWGERAHFAPAVGGSGAPVVLLLLLVLVPAHASLLQPQFFSN